jgi:peptide/nickel transport system permease protein
MFVYFIRRLPSLLLVVFGMSVVMFVISRTIPADPALAVAGQYATTEMVENIRREMSLDKPYVAQYLIYMKSLLRGDLGKSILSGRPVLDDMMDYLPATIEMFKASIIFSVLVGVPLGVISAVKPGKMGDNVSRIVSLMGICAPVFWLGLMLQLLFYKKIGILPFGGRLDMSLSPPATVTGLYMIDSLLEGNFTIFFNSLKHLILPAITMSNITLALTTRMTRSSLLDVLKEDYIRTARAKGLSETVVVYVHALRNAAIPVTTVVGLRVGTLLGGAVLTETIFAWPGIGRYAFKAIEVMDFPVLMGFAIVVVFLYAFINLALDVIYMILDPRMRPQN